MRLVRLTEKALTTTQRKKLRDTDFGLPEKRSYPMPDKKHVKYAIQMFDRSKKSDRDELAKNILKMIKKYKMQDEITVSRDNGFYKYWEK